MTRTDTSFVSGEPCIAYDQAGEGDIVLFLHWVDGNRSNWQDQSRAFVRNYHAAAWDARDYGASDDYAGPLDFGDFARDIVRLLDHLGAATAHIAGLSMGGQVALDLAARFPDRIKTLSLSGTRASFVQRTEAEWDEIVLLREKPLV